MSMDISIVIPTCGRSESLKRCLDSFRGQDYPLNQFEVIVVDDVASLDTKKIVEEAKKDLPGIRYLAQVHGGPAKARNLGIEASQGDIIGFVDDDCLVAKDWIVLALQAHRRFPKIACIGGETLLKEKKSSMMISQQLSTWSIETGVRGKKEIIFFPTCNVSCKKEIFRNHKFDERFIFPGGEDLEFFWRLFKDQHRFLWIKEMKVIHDRSDGFRSFLKQAAIYGRGNFLVQYLHRDHPLLGELKSGTFSFWGATLVNIIKIPRFSYLLGRRLIREGNVHGFFKKVGIYLFFVVHKIAYIAGNINQFRQIQKDISRKKEINLPRPRLLILVVTHRCNLSCAICDIWKTEKYEKDIDFLSIQRVLLEAKTLGIPEIALSGGEALLRNDIFEIFQAARQLEIKNLGVLSNGLLVETSLEKMIPYLLDNTISLVISFDSLKEDLHNRIRNSKVAWATTKKGLETLSRLKKENPHINFNVIVVILQQNLEELKEIALFVQSLGANSLQFQPLLPNNLKLAERKTSAYWISKDRWPLLDECLDELVAFKKQHPKFIVNSAPNLALIKKYYRGAISHQDVRCGSAGETVLISNSGGCATCYSCYGDIKEQKLQDILKSQKRRQAYQRVQKCSWPCLLPCFCDH